MSNNPFFAGSGQLGAPPGIILPYTPVLQGATDNPVPTYTAQVGRYCQIGNLVFFSFNIATSTMTKTTLTDAVQATLPIIAASAITDVKQFTARVENATAVLNGTLGEISSGASVCQFRNLPLAAASAVLTYAALSLGTLTNTITIRGSGFYEI